MIDLAVVVPATDDPPTLDRCLGAIERARCGGDEVVVVREPSTLSAGEARNRGVARAEADVVVFVDADVEVHPDALDRVRAAFADPGLTAVFGTYDDRPRAAGAVSRFRNLLHHHVHTQHGARPAETFWTGLGAVRRDAFLAVGGFDAERYPHPSIEDIDLGARLHDAGGSLRLEPAIQGTHLKAWTLRSMLWTDLARRGAPWVALQVERRRVAATLNCGWRHRVSALCVVGAVLALVVGLPVLAGTVLVALVLANRAFYGLLLRRLGVLRGTAGIGLHALHHLVAVASVPLGLAVAALRAGRPVGAPRAATPAVEGSPVS